jgi:hypothetical protein
VGLSRTVRFFGALLDVRVAIWDGPCLSPLLFELCFYAGLVWDLFLRLVGLL